MNHNDRLLRAVLQKLTKARLRPPTVARLLLAWSSLPLLVVAGAVGIVALVGLGVPSPVPTLIGGICLGAALRDVGIALRAARLWPIHQELFDWQKIEAMAEGMADMRGKT